MMRKTVKTALLFSSAALIVACGGNNKKSENAMTDKNADKGLSLAEMDTTVRPQDDFYNYVNGTWAKTAKIPADKPTWGSFHILREKTDENCLLILDNLLKENFAQGTEGQKIKDLYESFIDWKKRDAEGLKPIEGLLTKIDNIKTLADLQKYLEEVTPEGENPICAWGVYADMKDSNMNTVYLGNFSIGMGRDYYQKDNKENTEALQKYQDYVMAIFKVFKDDKAAEKAKQMVDFERSIAKLMLTNEEDRNPNLSYNPQTMAELSKLVKNINLPQLLKNVGVNTDKVVVSEIRLYKQYDKFINEKNLPLIKDYLKYQLVADNASNLTKELDELSFNFYSKELQALAKLNKFTVKVGYPDKWEDYSKLTIEPAAKSVYYTNLQRVNEWAYQKSLEKVGKPVDKTKWGMSPQTVNAYYNPLYNEIVFPAAILQPPFFNFEADPAVNFGGIGAVIGHEMTHGFDDSGAEFDGDGNLQNWWTPEDKKNFENATKALAKQYDQYEPVKGVFVNGTFTSGENIADLGGVNIAFDALQMYLKDKGNIDKISNFTQDQRFFISWGTVWRTLSTDKYLTNQVKTDPHSPGYFRSFGPLVNVDAWYKAFDVKEGDKLYKKPEDRIKIW